MRSLPTGMAISARTWRPIIAQLSGSTTPIVLSAPSATVMNFDIHYDPAPGHGIWSRMHFYFDLQNLANRTYVGSASNITDTLTNVAGVGVENPGYGSTSALAVTGTGAIYAGAPRLSIGGFRIKF